MWVKERKAAKHTAMCGPMQLSYIVCTCTPKPKMQLKKKVFIDIQLELLGSRDLFLDIYKFSENLKIVFIFTLS